MVIEHCLNQIFICVVVHLTLMGEALYHSRVAQLYRYVFVIFLMCSFSITLMRVTLCVFIF